MVRGWGGAATTSRALATGEEDAEEWAQGRGRGGDNSNANLDGGPDRNIHGRVEEVVDIGHAADEWDADDCSGRGTRSRLDLMCDLLREGRGCLHASDGKNGGDGELGTEIHL